MENRKNITNLIKANTILLKMNITRGKYIKFLQKSNKEFRKLFMLQGFLFGYLIAFLFMGLIFLAYTL